MLPRPTTIVLGLSLAIVASAQYNILKEYAGQTFFDEWNFYNNFDNLTNGNTNYVSAKDAASLKLAFINDAGNAVMKVDNTSSLKFPQRRNSIRINTKDRFTVGTVWIADMVHVPYGCSTWPAFWSSAPTWPDGGEIDTFEGVNQVTMNQMGLHASNGCVHSNSSVQSSTLINSTDCSIFANSNEGCIITNPTTKSYGLPFSQAGGGVWVTEFATKGISIWFFTRSNIPDMLQGNATVIDTAQLGIPVANWPSDGCAINEFFEPQSLIFDIALCGDYAGNANSFYQTCTGVCYQDWVLGDPSNFDTAYFEVSHVRVYGVPGELTVISSDAPRSITRSSILVASVVTIFLFTLSFF
ncbi:concanavalin A-like lectin/glucanase domain-containing protein [Abortiporus biennis]|nr:concanavalin A-like lectin/glucanase domain-containing protein [Abortiporus biennis]